MHKRYKDITLKCLNCGVEFNPWIGRPNSKYCGSSCAMKYRYKQDPALGRKLTKEAHEIVRNGKTSGDNHYKWKDGKHLRRGYVIKTYAPGKQREEHILIAQEKIGRKLNPDECVHHINGIKNDNRPENLLVMTKSQHSSLHNHMRYRKAA